MKSTLLLFALLHFSIYASGQLSFGVKAGLNVNDMAIGNKPKGLPYNPEGNIGFHAGIFATIKLGGKWSFIPEAQFSKRGYNGDRDIRINLNYIELPLLLSYSPVKLVSLDLGPNLGYKISAVAKSDDASNNVDFIYDNDFDLGLSAGVRLNLGERISIVGRYYQGLTPINEISTRDVNNYPLDEIKEFNQTVQLGLSYRIK